MSIVSMLTLLEQAGQGAYAIGYYESWDAYALEAVIEAAEQTHSPLILGFGGAVADQPWMERWGVEEMTALVRTLAERTALPAAVLFNEARTLQQVQRGLRAGCNAVMLDTSHLPFQENVILTRQVVELAHAQGASVEAELGHLPDATPGAASGAAHTTDPAEAACFVERTDVDALAVSIGNTHVLVEGEATVDLELLERIHQAVPVPLVIHGGTGFPRWAVPSATARGVCKFNVGTRLKQAYLQGLRAAIAALPDHPNLHAVIGSRAASDILAQGRARIVAEILALMRLYGSAGRA